MTLSAERCWKPASFNEILTALNKPDDFILAIVESLEAGDHRVHYLRHPFHREPDFGVTSVNYKLDELIARAGGAGVKAFA